MKSGGFHWISLKSALCKKMRFRVLTKYMSLVYTYERPMKQCTRQNTFQFRDNTVIVCFNNLYCCLYCCPLTEIYGAASAISQSFKFNLCFKPLYLIRTCLFLILCWLMVEFCWICSPLMNEHQTMVSCL